MSKLLNFRSSKAAPARTPNATYQLGRILVVADDVSLHQLGTESLIRHGYRVDTATDNKTGWNAIQTRIYDLLITDLDMPRSSGLRLVKKLRDARIALPVILASGAMTPDELSRTPWLHLSGALLKPVSFAQLLQTVQAVLRGPESDCRQVNQRPNSRGSVRLHQ